MKKSIYATRNIKTNKIEKIFIRNSDVEIEEDRTWFYFEWEFEEDKNWYTERFLNELFLLHKLT